jgi:hypothetical protein
MHQVIRRLNDDGVVDAVFWIEPEIWLKQNGAIKLGEQTGRNLLFGYANFERVSKVVRGRDPNVVADAFELAGAG